MKLTIALLAVLFSLNVFADFRGNTYRYSTSYESFDRVTYSTYEYSESYYSNDYCSGYRTCYHPSMRNERVYIEERVVEERYVSEYRAETRVTIYTDKHYTRPYVTYHTHNGRIVNRTYHSNHHYYSWHYGHNHYHDYYYHDYHHYHNHYYYTVDWSTPEGKIITGLHFMASGVELMAHCQGIQDDDWKAICTAFGFGIAMSGSASSAEGIDQAINESKLYTELKEDAEKNGEKDLDLE